MDWRNYCTPQGWEVCKPLTDMRHPHDLVTDTGESPGQIREEIVQMKKRYPKVMNSLLRDAEADAERVGGKNYARWKRIVSGLLMLALGSGMNQ